MVTYLIVSLGEAAATVDLTVPAVIASGDCHQIESGKWLINSSRVTSREVSDALGLSALAVTHFIAPLRGYYGLARPDIWEWLAAKSGTVNA